LQPVDAHLLVAGTAGQFGHGDGVYGDRRLVERRVSHVTLATELAYRYISAERTI